MDTLPKVPLGSAQIVLKLISTHWFLSVGQLEKIAVCVNLNIEGGTQGWEESHLTKIKLIINPKINPGFLKFWSLILGFEMSGLLHY